MFVEVSMKSVILALLIIFTYPNTIAIDEKNHIEFEYTSEVKIKEESTIDEIESTFESLLVTKKMEKDKNEYADEIREDPNFQKKIQKWKKIFKYAKKKLNEENLPEEFAFIPVVESGLNPKNITGSARGLWQIDEKTGEAFGLKKWDCPYQSTDVAVKYLRYLVDQFDGDIGMALLAYNAGESKIRRLASKYDYQTLMMKKKKLPSITRRYISKCAGVAEVIKELENS